MAYKNYVQIGRLLKVDNKSKYNNQLAVIVDILNVYSVLVQNQNKQRFVLPIKAAVLTDFVEENKFPLSKEQASEIADKLIADYKQSPAGLQDEKVSKRSKLTDFQRFTAQKLMKERNEKIRELMHGK